MSAIKVNKANFEEIKNSEKVVLLDFYADWCGPCRMVGPVIEEIAEERADIEAFVRKNGLERVNYIAIFDAKARSMSAADLVWLGAANSDPRRDVRMVGRALVLDARSKRPGIEGNPSRFPNVVTSSPETIALVDERWAEYECGEFIPSPSLHYRELLLSESEQW